MAWTGIPKRYFRRMSSLTGFKGWRLQVVVYTAIAASIVILRQHLYVQMETNAVPSHFYQVTQDTSNKSSHVIETRVISHSDVSIQNPIGDSAFRTTINSKSATNNSKSATNNSKSATIKSKSETINRKSATINSKSAINNSKSVTNHNKSATINSKSATNKSKSAIINSNSATKNNKSTTNNNNIVSTNTNNATTNSYGTQKVKSKHLTESEANVILDQVEDWFHIIQDSNKDKLLNLHLFEYKLNSNMCENEFGVLIFVHSATDHVFRRQRIRETWGSVKHYNNVSISTVFMLGQSQDLATNVNLTKESLKYGDIVQGNFLDSYKNLTYKHVLALYWVTTNCRHVKTVVKVDDDVLINIYRLAKYSLSVGHLHNKLYCSYFNQGKAIRNKFDKWYTPETMYPFDIYPRYCEGLAYIVSAEEVTRLLAASEDTRFYWVDDVYVTGILARKAGIGHVHFGANHTYSRKSMSLHSHNNDVMFYVEYDDWTDIWNKIMISEL